MTVSQHTQSHECEAEENKAFIMLTRGIFAAVFYKLWRIKTCAVQKVCGKSLNAPNLPVQQNQYETVQSRQEDINYNVYAGCEESN